MSIMKLTPKYEKKKKITLKFSIYVQIHCFTRAHITFKMSTIFKKVKPLVSFCIRWWYKVFIFIFQVLEKKQIFISPQIKNKQY